MKKRYIHQDVYVGFICFAVCLLIYSLNMSLSSDAALMPKLLCVMLMILSVCIVGSGIKKSKLPEDQREKPGLTWDAVKIPLVAWGIVLGYALLFYLIGYYIATAIMLVVFMRFMKQTSWKQILLIDAGYLIVIYFGFVKLLGVSLNSFGLLERLL